MQLHIKKYIFLSGFFIAFALLQWSSHARSASIKLICDGGFTKDDSCIIQLHGPMEAGDSKKFEKMIIKANSLHKVVSSAYLYSRGGLVIEGTRIGELIRKNLIYTNAPSRAYYYPEVDGALSFDEYSTALRAGAFSYFTGVLFETGDKPRTATSNARISEIEGYVYDPEIVCASACALAYFGGVYRSGVVGLHHMSVRDKNVEYNKLEDILAESAGLVHKYLNDMRTPKGVFEIMNNTSSLDLHWYQEIGEYDPIFLEYVMGRCPGPSESEDERAVKLEMVDRLGFEVLGYAKAIPRRLTGAERGWLKEYKKRRSKHFECAAPLEHELRKKAQLE